MKLLLDTHMRIWGAPPPEKLSRNVGLLSSRLNPPSNTVAVFASGRPFRSGPMRCWLKRRSGKRLSPSQSPLRRPGSDFPIRPRNVFLAATASLLTTGDSKHRTAMFPDGPNLVNG